MNNHSKRVCRKKIIIAVICVFIIALAVIGLTLTKYTTEEMRGEVNYEPALFNTVLLGKLVQSDIDNLTSITSETYTVVDGNTSYTQSVTGKKLLETVSETDDETGEVTSKKLAASIDLSEDVEFGKNIENGEYTDDAKIAPGSDSSNHGYIYFTVTNGTTVEDETETTTSTTTQEDGKDPVTTTTTTEQIGKLKNVAQSDIRYTLHIITTNNLPLEYKLIDLDANIEYELVDTLEEDSTVNTENVETGNEGTVESSGESNNEGENTGTDSNNTGTGTGDNTATETSSFQASSDYIVKTDTVTTGEGDEAVTTIKNESVFVNGTRLLKCNDDGSISVHRYKLEISWPSSGSRIIGGKSVKNNDLSYMKEIENVEVRIEVESYVNHIDRTGSDNTYAKGVMVIQNTPVYDNVYTLSKKTTTGENITYTGIGSYSDKIVAYNNFAELADADKKTGCSKEYEYLLQICNGDSISAQWVSDDSAKNNFQDSVTGTSPTRAENGQTNKNGHYTYVNSYSSVAGNYTVAMAVPTGSTYNTEGVNTKDRSSSLNNYYVYYNDKLYTGVLESDVVITDIYDQDEDATSSNVTFSSYKKEVYKVLRFYNDEDGDGDFEEDELLTLTMNSNGIFQCEDLSIRMGLAEANTANDDDFRLYITKITEEE